MLRRATLLPLPCFAPHAGGDGALGEPGHRAGIARKASVFAQQETGVRFESLVLFADPLFDLYDIDQLDAFALKGSPEEADEAVVAVLEAARLFWAYFALPAGEQPDQLPALSNFLLGPEQTPEDEADLDLLLDRMKGHWQMLTPEDRRIAEDTDAPTLGFDALLAHPVYAGNTRPPDASGYGPENLSELEAQALFAQPLLDDAEEPEAIEAAMDRATAYWEIAHSPEAHRDQLIEDVARSFASGRDQRATILREARDMIDRFAALFPERRT